MGLYLSKQDIHSWLSRYKTTAAKKAAITRDIKAFKQQAADYEKAYKERQKGKVYGWYLGERVFAHTVERPKRDIQTLLRYQKEYLS